MVSIAAGKHTSWVRAEWCAVIGRRRTRLSIEGVAENFESGQRTDVGYKVDAGTGRGRKKDELDYEDPGELMMVCAEDLK